MTTKEQAALDWLYEKAVYNFEEFGDDYVENYNIVFRALNKPCRLKVRTLIEDAISTLENDFIYSDYASELLNDALTALKGQDDD